MGRESIGLLQVHEALNAMGLLEEILALPDGLSTKLSVGGNPLTAGQAERLVLARAIIGRPRLIVIDNALQAVRAPDRERIIDRLLAPRAPWSLLLISEDTDLLDRCDQVWTLDSGRVAKSRTT